MPNHLHVSFGLGKYFGFNFTFGSKECDHGRLEMIKVRLPFPINLTPNNKSLKERWNHRALCKDGS